MLVVPYTCTSQLSVNQRVQFRRSLSMGSSLQVIQARILESVAKSVTTSPMHATSPLQVVFTIPNVVGYARMALQIGALLIKDKFPFTALAMIITNLTLDFFDGYLARKLGQLSSFGAFLDVVIDNFSRATLWAASIPGPWAAVPICYEALTFTCTHAADGAAWKTGYFSSAPVWAQVVMKNGFKTPLGAFVIAGLMGMPVWLWARVHLPASNWTSLAVGAVLLVGRLVGAAVESWVLYSYMVNMIKVDMKSTDQLG